MDRPTVMIIGASRGLGCALAGEYLARGWHVIGTTRARSGTKLHALAGSAALRIAHADINDPTDIARLKDEIGNTAIDLMIVNAGVTNGIRETPPQVSDAEFALVMKTNALSPMRALEALEGAVPATGTLAIISSSMGSNAANVSGGWEIYRASKAALNSLMRSFHARHRDDPRTMLLLNPGWLQTDMGGPGAPLTVAAVVPGFVDVIGRQNGRAGLHFLDHTGETIPW